MDSLRNSEMADGLGADIAITSDLSALSWVHDELRRSVDHALKALRRHVRELESVATCVNSNPVSISSRGSAARRSCRSCNTTCTNRLVRLS